MTPDAIVNAIAAVVSITVVVIGWFFNANRNRELAEKNHANALELQRQALEAERDIQLTNHAADRELQRENHEKERQLQRENHEKDRQLQRENHEKDLELQRANLEENRLLHQENEKKDRALQRKQLAIQVLHENRYEEMWVKSLHVAFTAARDHDGEFFRSLITRHLDKTQELSEEEQEIRQGVQLVMNSFEFIAIGILNKAIDEDIVKWSFGNLYRKLYDVLSIGYIPVLRQPEGAHDVYINFTTLVERWNPDVQKVPDIARQT